MTDNNEKILERSRSKDSKKHENELYADIQTAIVAVMAVILEAGDRANGEFLTDEAPKYVNRARAVYAETMQQMRTDGI